jgi:hypothetical protein
MTRWTAALAALLLAPLLPTTTAHGQAADPNRPPATAAPPNSFAAFCAHVPDDYEPFDDLDGNLHKDAIECMAFVGVTKGGPADLPPGSYGPDVTVRRDAMASFLARLMDVAHAHRAPGHALQELPPYDGTPAYPDIEGNTHEDAISRLGENAIGLGYPGADGGANEFRPLQEVDRGQIAAYLVFGLEWLRGQPVDGHGDYFDDDTGSPHEVRHDALAENGISTGTGPRTYGPADGLRRDQMASLLARSLGLLGGAVQAPEEPVVAAAADPGAQTRRGS